MKKYIIGKTVEAEPMTLGDYVRKTGRNPYINVTDVHDNSENGYIVKYNEGLISWCPAERFEIDYRPCDTYLDRLRIERDELSLRYNKAQNFYYSPKFKELLCREEQQAFETQIDLMRKYLAVLNARIQYAENKSKI